MRTYLIRRILLIIPTLLIATALVFGLTRTIPGSVIDQMLAEHVSVTERDIESLRKDLGLDVQIHIQYVRWLGDIVTRGDLGNSLWKDTPVSAEIVKRLPVTAELATLAILIGCLISIPIGIYSAIRQDTIGDYVTRSAAILAISVPGFWIGTMVFVFPALWWNWAPEIQLIKFTDNPLGNLVQFVIPATVMGLGLTGVMMRMTRTMMLEVLRQDYIRTAWSKGLRERVVVIRHALKNAIIPVITMMGTFTAGLMGGSVIIEQIFVLPGLGRLMVESVFSRDYPVIVGTMLFLSIIVLVSNLLVDLVYAFLDPRIHLK